MDLREILYAWNDWVVVPIYCVWSIWYAIRNRSKNPGSSAAIALSAVLMFGWVVTTRFVSLDWRMVITDLGLLIGVSAGLAWAASSFRIRRDKRWIPGAVFVLGYAACIAGVIQNDSLVGSMSERLGQLNSPPEPSHLEEHWGKDLPAVDRTRYSEMLARNSYRYWGLHVNYFDLDGRLRPYESTDEDRQEFLSRAPLIARIRTIIDWFRVIGFLWLVAPLAALGLSFLRPAPTASGRSQD